MIANVPAGVAIAIVPRDRFSTFPRCIDAVYQYTHSPFRVLVVAGAIDPATANYFQDVQRQKNNLEVVLADDLLMQGASRNLALRTVSERLCVILENDTIVHDGWLEPLLECMATEKAAVVTPLIVWHRGIHAAGCMFDENTRGSTVMFDHKILYTDIRRKRIDYPECHCLLVDRQQLPDADLFDDVEPFDVDLGLQLRSRGLSVFVEPRSVATYAAPPPLEVADVAPYKFRWDAESWADRNRLFTSKWGISYNAASRKVRSYRRQYMRLGLARWYASRATVALANTTIAWERRLQSVLLSTSPNARS